MSRTTQAGEQNSGWFKKTKRPGNAERNLRLTQGAHEVIPNPSHTEPISEKNRYMPGLDGLRALAVLAVIAYHLNLGFAPGGLLGVGVFFVLSGYLITDILVMDFRRKGHLDLRDFWLRRARRLLPALFLMLVVVVVFITLFRSSELPPIRGDVLAAVLYVSNWWFVFHHVSYFASFGPPSPLGHLWSLAVEEQFYLLWPLLLALGLRYIRRRGPLVGLTLAFALASVLAMVLLYNPGTDPSRVYYGTDTRAFALLIGAALAMMWPSRKLRATVSRRARLVLDVSGGTALFTILFMIWQTNEYEVFLYRGGLVLVSVATAIVIAVLAHPASGLGRILGCKPLRWLGVRSYGIYLWHYPVILLTSPSVDTTGLDIPRAIIQVVASIALAAFSWRFIEQPIRYGTLRGAKSERSHAMRPRPAPGRWMASVGGVLSLAVLGICMIWPISAATASSANSMPALASVTPGNTASSGMDEPSTQNSSSMSNDLSSTADSSDTNVAPSSGTSGAQTDAGQNAATQGKGQKQQGAGQNAGQQGIGQNSVNLAVGQSTARQGGGQNVANQVSGQSTALQGGDQGGSASSSGFTQAKGSQSSGGPLIAKVSGRSITALGDSVMIDTAPYLTKMLPGIVIDAHVGRQMYQAPAVLSQLKASGQLGNVVIIELGTNGPFTKAQLESLLKSLSSARQIILVNTRVPRPWESVVNSTLANAAKTYPNTTLVDWYTASAGKNNYFYPDGVHLNPQGSMAYAALVAKAIHPAHAG